MRAEVADHGAQRSPNERADPVAEVRLGSWLCENAKTLNRDRRSCSSKTVLVAQRASGFNLEIELKNIILRRVSIFEFLHSQGQKLTSRGGPLLADIVAKVSMGGERKFLEPLMRFTPQDVGAGVEKRRSGKEVQRSAFARFYGWSIFDFCNSIGAKRTFGKPAMSAKEPASQELTLPRLDRRDLTCLRKPCCLHALQVGASGRRAMRSWPA